MQKYSHLIRHFEIQMYFHPYRGLSEDFGWMAIINYVYNYKKFSGCFVMEDETKEELADKISGAIIRTHFSAKCSGYNLLEKTASTAGIEKGN